MSFLRVKLIEVQFEDLAVADPFCAVKILEVQKREDGDTQLQQKKKTFYPQWNRCFDSHLVDGRRMQVIVMDKVVSFCSVRTDHSQVHSLVTFLVRPFVQEGGNDRPVAQVTVETEILAEECRQEEDGHVVKLEVRPLLSMSPFRAVCTVFTALDRSVLLKCGAWRSCTVEQLVVL